MTVLFNIHISCWMSMSHVYDLFSGFNNRLAGLFELFI